MVYYIHGKAQRRWPPVWVKTEAQLPTKADADSLGRVWVIALDATDRAYPDQATPSAIAAFGPRLYPFWARPPVEKKK